jgi:hypothetical protein
MAGHDWHSIALRQYETDMDRFMLLPAAHDSPKPGHRQRGKFATLSFDRWIQTRLPFMPRRSILNLYNNKSLP